MNNIGKIIFGIIGGILALVAIYFLILFITAWL